MWAAEVRAPDENAENCEEDWVTVSTRHQWASMHPSHAVKLTGMIAWCDKCGKYSSYNKTLNKECQGMHADKVPSCLQLLRKGRIPNAKATVWPSGQDLQEVLPTVQLRINVVSTEEEAQR